MCMMGTETADASSSSNEKINLKISFFSLGLVTVSLPSVALLICLITAVLFRYDRITETACNVRNQFFSGRGIYIKFKVKPISKTFRLPTVFHQ